MYNGLARPAGESVLAQEWTHPYHNVLPYGRGQRGSPTASMSRPAVEPFCRGTENSMDNVKTIPCCGRGYKNRKKDNEIQ